MMTVAVNTSAHTVASIPDFLRNGQFLFGQEIFIMSLEHFIVPESKEVIPRLMRHVNTPSTQCERTLMGQRWESWGKSNTGGKIQLIKTQRTCKIL